MKHDTAVSLSSDITGRNTSESIGRILVAAEELFAEHGFEAASIHEIAERAGVSKANIFHHFSTKRELYLAVLHNACQGASERLHGLENTNGTFSERFAGFSADMLNNMLEQEQVHRLIHRELLSDDHEQLAKELAERIFGDKFKRLVGILRHGQAAGELRADFNPAMAAIVLIGANRFFLHGRNVFKHFPDVSFATNPQCYSKLLIDVLLRGILATPTDPSNKNE